MKNYIVTTFVALLLAGTCLNITAEELSSTNSVAVGKEAGSWELTLGGGGETVNDETVFGVDLTLSTNPFNFRPEVWVGLAQSVYWEPSFAGSTDLFVDWSQDLWNDTLYLNVGWSVGALYDDSELSQWRTGPEATLQYYTSDTAFIYAGVNYDVWVDEGEEGGFRYSFGVGLSF